MEISGPVRRFDVIVTDMESPNITTPAGIQLQANMEELRKLKCTTDKRPRQNVSVFKIPQPLLQEAKVFIVGSPANHNPDNRPLPGQEEGSKLKFKQNVFYSMCWYTPTNSAALMTFSLGACTRGERSLEWWTVPGRTFMLAPAWFRWYRPSRGLADCIERLAEDPENPDTMIAIFAPEAFMKKLQWRDEPDALKLDVAATVLNWLGESGKLVTFGAYTAELELDIARRASCMQHGST